MKKTTTIRINTEVKSKLDEIRGKASYNKFIDYLVDFFMGDNK